MCLPQFVVVRNLILGNPVCRPLEQIQMWSPVNHFARRDRPSRSALMVGRPRRDRYDDHRQRNNHCEPKSKTISFLCHLFPSWQRTASRYGNLRGRNRERCVNYFTLSRNRRSPSRTPFAAQRKCGPADVKRPRGRLTVRGPGVPLQPWSFISGRATPPRRLRAPDEVAAPSSPPRSGLHPHAHEAG